MASVADALTGIPTVARPWKIVVEPPLLSERTWTEILAHRPLVDLDEFATVVLGENRWRWNTLLAHWS